MLSLAPVAQLPWMWQALAAFFVLLLLWQIMRRSPLAGLVILAWSSLLGQLVRFPLLGQGGGILATDVLVGVFLLALVSRRELWRQSFRQRTGQLLFLFLSWAIISAWWRLPSLSFSEGMVMVFYLVRFIFTWLVIWIATTTLSFSGRFRLLWWFWGSTLLLALAALVQLWLLPDLTFLSRYGWDPHQGRAVGTWLDPNFLGMALVGGVWLSLFLFPFTPLPWRGLFGVAAGTIVLAMIATFSRTSWIAMLVGLGWWIWHKHSRIGALWLFWCLILVLGVGFGGRLLWHSATLGPNFAKRLESYRQAWEVWQQNFLFGVGYNRYGLVREQLGLIQSQQLHARAGADSSLLTLAATTGILGLAFFFLLVGQLVRRWWKEARQGGIPWYTIAVAIGLSWLVHAQGVNSLWYLHLMVLLLPLVFLSKAP
jgi:O-antigen ligase